MPNAQTEPRPPKAKKTRGPAKNERPPSVGSSGLLGSVSFLSIDRDKVKFALPPHAQSMSFNRAGIEVIVKDLNQWLSSGILSHTQESLQGLVLSE